MEEKEFQKIVLEQLSNLNSKVEDLSSLKPKVEELTSKVEDLYALIPKINESHLWLGTLVENKDVQKAEMDNLTMDVTKMKGVFKGFEKSLDLLKKAE